MDTSTPDTSPRLQRPEAVLFDLGGTILSAPSYDGTAGMRALFRYAVGLDTEKREALALQAAAKEREILAQTDGAPVQMTTGRLLRLISDLLGVRFSITPDQMEWELWRGAIDYRPEPGVESVLNALARRSIPLGLLSNNYYGAQVIRKELARHDLERFFRAVLSSADYGLRKPAAAVLHAAAGVLGAAPVRTWYVGDSLEADVKGARAAGMTAIWYNPKGLEAPVTAPDLTLASWPELEFALAALR